MNEASRCVLSKFGSNRGDLGNLHWRTDHMHTPWTNDHVVVVSLYVCSIASLCV